MRENYELQKSVGASILLLEPRELQRKFPWINTEGIKLASLGTLGTLLIASLNFSEFSDNHNFR